MRLRIMKMFRLLKRSLFTNQSATPRKLILLYQQDKTELSQALSQRIKKELKEAYLTAHEIDEIFDSPQVPYTVIITNRTLVDGVLLLQHYNTKIREEVHVSDLKQKLVIQISAMN